ncbi:MAG: hypothetical protein D6761_12545 [Candidatus Dadabacteria bacterium]|nr:MAG: hypothetical protein D6761_12545 [Candidatus Dadabacteria bacterium]
MQGGGDARRCWICTRDGLPVGPIDATGGTVGGPSADLILPGLSDADGRAELCCVEAGIEVKLPPGWRCTRRKGEGVARIPCELAVGRHRFRMVNESALGRPRRSRWPWLVVALVWSVAGSAAVSRTQPQHPSAAGGRFTLRRPAPVVVAAAIPSAATTAPTRQTDVSQASTRPAIERQTVAGAASAAPLPAAAAAHARQTRQPTDDEGTGSADPCAQLRSLIAKGRLTEALAIDCSTFSSRLHQQLEQLGALARDVPGLLGAAAARDELIAADWLSPAAASAVNRRLAEQTETVLAPMVGQIAPETLARIVRQLHARGIALRADSKIRNHLIEAAATLEARARALAHVDPDGARRICDRVVDIAPPDSAPGARCRDSLTSE